MNRIPYPVNRDTPKGRPGMRRGGRQWRKLRADWADVIAERAAAGNPVICRRCNRPILPGQRWQLGHPDTMPVATHGHHAHDLAPEHASENERAGAQLRHTLAARTGRVTASTRWNRGSAGPTSAPRTLTAQRTGDAATAGFLAASPLAGDPSPLRNLSPLKRELSRRWPGGRVCVWSGPDRDGDAPSGPDGAGFGRIGGGAGGGRGAGRGTGGWRGQGRCGARVPGRGGSVGAAAAAAGWRAVR